MDDMIAKLVFFQNGKTLRKIAIPKNKSVQLTIGNGKVPVDITIASNIISRNHAEIISDVHNSLFIKDLNSTNGTFINGRQLQANEKRRISIGNVITFANDPAVQMIVAEPHQAIDDNTTPPTGGGPVQKLPELLKQKQKVTIGRSRDCDLSLPSTQNVISRHHAVIEKISDTKYRLRDTSRNGTYVNERLITGETTIDVNDTIRIGSYSFKLRGGRDVSESKQHSLSEYLKQKSEIIIGRAQDCDISLDDNQVSRQHAQIGKDAKGYFVRDLGSTNGTYLNGELVKGKIRFTEKDKIHVGLYEFRLNKAARNLSLETAIRAEHIEKTYPNGYTGLKRMSVNIPHKAFIALMGPSGCGKTTLMNALNGNNPATSGNVFIHGLELKANYNLLKRKIGYVPQDDIVHRELSVDKSLYYAAKLRMPDDTSEQEIMQRIDEVCDSLNINDPEIRNNRVKELSGGQRKRVSIAVELLNNPSILFLDEPTSPLDPETIDEFLNSIKRLTEQGTTVVMVTHKPEDLRYVDRVIFLATKGYIAFYGSEDNLYDHFQVENHDIIRVYSVLSKKGKNEENVKQWYNKWLTTQQDDKAITESRSAIQKRGNESLLRQFFWQTRRYFNIKLNDVGNMSLLMAQPLVIAGLLIFIFENLQLGVLFLMAVAAIWFGVSNAAKEIVGEIPIYRRERMFNLNIFTYLFSKIAVLSVIALVQVLIFILIVHFRYLGDELHLVHLGKYIGFMFYLAVSATLLGLLLSSVFSNTEKVMTVVPIALMPQIMLAGVITRIDHVVKELLSYLTLGRWGTEGFCWIQDNYDAYQVTDTLLFNRQTDTTFTEIAPCPTNPNIVLEQPDEIIMSYDTTFKVTNKSIYSSVPETTQDTLLVQDTVDVPYQSGELATNAKANAIDQLGFYDKTLIDNSDLLGIFNSFEANMLVITTINLIVFAGIYIALKRKDTI